MTLDPELRQAINAGDMGSGSYRLKVRPERVEEKFTFPTGHVACIKEEPKEWTVWWGGCMIGGASTLASARELLHDFALARFDKEWNNLRKRVKVYDQVTKQLGDDPFHLGRFLEE